MLRGLPSSNGVLFGVKVSEAATKPMSGVAPAKRSGAGEGAETQYELDYRIDAGDLTWTQSNGKASIDIHLLMSAYDVKNKLLVQVDRPLQLEYTAEQYAQRSKGIEVKQRVALPQGVPLFLRLGVLDSRSRHVGTVEIPTGRLQFVATSQAKP